jgi:hypothetical protein
VHTKCFGQYKEGCVVGERENKLQLVLSQACADALVRAASCKEAEAILAKPVCR